MHLFTGKNKNIQTAAAALLAAVFLLQPAAAVPVQAAGYTVTEDTAEFHNLDSEFAVLVNVDTGEIVASRNADAQMYPASMTKIMTVLTAAEEIDRNGINLSDTVEITQDILDYVVQEQGTAVGFVAGERPTVMDLLWGTALPSGADAALALARRIAGTEEAFVDLMNEKAQSMGLTATHFQNPVGMYDEENYTTPEEMAMILEEATKNELAWAVLSTQQYTTVRTRQHPEGITVHNRFLKRLSRQNVPGIVFSAKTGYVSKAGSCASSFFVANDGTRYMCVTGKAGNTWQCIYDQAAIYRVYCTPEEEEEEPEEITPASMELQEEQEAGDGAETAAEEKTEAEEPVSVETERTGTGEQGAEQSAAENTENTEETAETAETETDRDAALERAIRESRSAAGNKKAKDTNWLEN